MNNAVSSLDTTSEKSKKAILTLTTKWRRKRKRRRKRRMGIRLVIGVVTEGYNSV